MGTLRAHGFEVDVPAGWDGRVSVRAAVPAATPPEPTGLGTATTEAVAAAEPLAVDAVQGDEFPVVHVANFPLPAEIGDYGGGATEAMRPSHLLVNLAEFGPNSVGTALYPEITSMPVLRPADFDPQRMQRPLPGQSGAQRFFTLGGRAFGLYVVLGSHRRRLGTVPLVNDIIAGIRIV